MSPTNRKPKVDLTSASYLDDLATRTASSQVTQTVQALAATGKLSLPLDGPSLNNMLDNTVIELNRQGKLAWFRTPGVRKEVFIMAWYREMQRLGVA